VNSPYDAASGADALLILTEWEEFASLDLDRLHRQLKYPIVIDGRNLYDPEAMTARGFTYYSVGRSVGVPVAAPAPVTTSSRKSKK
jgi:UDPglucose 6-dehydrogenase